MSPLEDSENVNPIKYPYFVKFNVFLALMKFIFAVIEIKLVFRCIYYPFLCVSLRLFHNK